jgi:hypothetical protein
MLDLDELERKVRAQGLNGGEQVQLIIELRIARRLRDAVLADTDNREPSESTDRIEAALDEYDKVLEDV